MKRKLYYAIRENLKFKFSVISQIQLIVLFLFGAVLVAQEQHNQPNLKGWGIPEHALNCEMNFQNLEYLSNLRSKYNQKSFVIAIARLGDGENRRELNSRRLYNVSTSLSNNLLNIPTEKIVIAEGEQVKGLGRVEFYLGGEMIGSLLIKKDADICVSCCGPDERFYPYKEEFKRKYRRGRRNSK